jgi:hypothetical protein
MSHPRECPGWPGVEPGPLASEASTRLPPLLRSPSFFILPPAFPLRERLEKRVRVPPEFATVLTLLRIVVDDIELMTL